MWTLYNVGLQLEKTTIRIIYSLLCLIACCILIHHIKKKEVIFDAPIYLKLQTTEFWNEFMFLAKQNTTTKKCNNLNKNRSEIVTHPMILVIPLNSVTNCFFFFLFFSMLSLNLIRICGSTAEIKSILRMWSDFRNIVRLFQLRLKSMLFKWAFHFEYV